MSPEGARGRIALRASVAPCAHTASHTHAHERTHARVSSARAQDQQTQVPAAAPAPPPSAATRRRQSPRFDPAAPERPPPAPPALGPGEGGVWVAGKGSGGPSPPSSAPRTGAQLAARARPSSAWRPGGEPGAEGGRLLTHVLLGAQRSTAGKSSAVSTGLRFTKPRAVYKTQLTE